MMLAILVITLLTPGLAFLIFIVFQALLGKADPPRDGAGESPGNPDDTTDHKENAEL